MKRYDEEFQKEAVEMPIYGECLIRRFAGELEVSPQTLIKDGRQVS